jgi:hypothetical protein
MKYAVLAFLLVSGCSYRYTISDPELAQRVAALEAREAEQSSVISALQSKESEQDAKIRVMWTHGK